MRRKLRDKSQFVPDYLRVSVQFSPHSQMGDGYKIAELGSVDELYGRLQKYDIEDVPINKEISLDAINYFCDKIKKCQFYDFERAISDMDKSKSIGFGAKQEGCFSREDPNMRKYLFDYIRLSSIQPHHCIINASQKDEIRVASKTPRLFMAFPPEHTLLASMCVGDFVDQFLDHHYTRDHNISAVGDAVQNGAAAYYKYMLSKRPNLYCTDTSAQDSSIHPDFINLVYDVIKTKYKLNSEQDQMFESVRFNSINKMVNVNGELYLVRRGLGSGDYLTSIINIMWRLYMVMENYKHDYVGFFRDNTIIINGDDLIMSSEFNDLDLSSRHAKIEWAGRPVTWKEMDFCSVSFEPFIHHDPKKVEAVLNFRKRKIHQLSPDMEMQRLGGLLRVLCTRDMYDEILSRMLVLKHNHPETSFSFDNMFITYEELYGSYNRKFK